MQVKVLLVPRVRIAAGRRHLLRGFQRHCAHFARPRHWALRDPCTTKSAVMGNNSAQQGWPTASTVLNR